MTGFSSSCEALLSLESSAKTASCVEGLQIPLLHGLSVFCFMNNDVMD